jgi:hypothetical protein
VLDLRSYLILATECHECGVREQTSHRFDLEHSEASARRAAATELQNVTLTDGAERFAGP